MKNSDLNEIVLNGVRVNGLFPHRIESMNTCYIEGIKVILTQIFEIRRRIANVRSTTEEDRKIVTIEFDVKFLNTKLTKPMDLNDKPMMPADARLQGKSYMGYLIVDVVIRATAYLSTGETIVREDKLLDYTMAEIPIMVGSIYCNTYGMSKEALLKVGEDPNDPQGIFVINGSEWTIDNLISRKFNMWHYYNYRGDPHAGENARAEFISIPGDSFENSSELIIRYHVTGEITFTFVSDRYLKQIGIPFYLFFKLFGILSEQAIFENIVPHAETSEKAQRMREILAKALLVSYKDFPSDTRHLTSVNEIKMLLIKHIAIKYVFSKGVVTLEERARQVRQEEIILHEVLMTNFDINVMPHHGKAPENRFDKAVFICLGVRRVLECYMGMYPSTDRDCTENKRILPPGDSFAKMIKKEINSAIVRPMRKIFEDTAGRTSFSNIDLAAMFKQGCKTSTLKTSIISNLNQGMGEKIIDGKVVKNRMPSENIKRRNFANTVNMGTIQRSTNSMTAYKNERSIEMRDVQYDATGMNCKLYSGEGQNVGMTPATTMSVELSKATSTEIMYQILMETGLVIDYKKVHGVSYTRTKVYVNGRWIGYVDRAKHLYNIVRNRRRGFDSTGARIANDIMDRKCSIYWDNEKKEIDFRTDRGRPLSPFLVVYNTLDDIGFTALKTKLSKGVKRGDEFTGENFLQDILLTQRHVEELQSGATTINDLFSQGIVDWLSAEELRQVVCSPTIENLVAKSTDVFSQYTHLIIPVSMFSIISLLTPYAHNAPPGRVTMATNQLRQTCSPYVCNYNYRFDKQGYFQITNQVPQVYTISSYFIPFNGRNEIIAITLEDGKNMEDSLVANKTAMERGAFNINKLSFLKYTLDQREEFGVPDESTTDNINKKANYSKIDSKGFLPRGTKIVKGDVVVGKLYRYEEFKDSKIYRDISEVYEDAEEAYIMGVEYGVDGDMKTFINYRIEIPREMSVGQKMSSRNGQKGMASDMKPQSDLSFTASGEVFTLAISPLAFPSRMTYNQLMEGVAALAATELGICIDSTYSIATDIGWINDLLEEAGYLRDGVHRMFNGVTGKFYNTPIFMAPNYYCRLQKFWQENAYAIGNSGQRSFTSRQPIAGKSREGGLRLGEMEKDCFYSHGAVRFITNKFYKNSDGIKLYLCRNCGNRCIVNKHKKIAECKICGPNAKPAKFPTRFASHNVLSIIEAQGAIIKFITTPYEVIKTLYKD